jgi:laccase
LLDIFFKICKRSNIYAYFSIFNPATMSLPSVRLSSAALVFLFTFAAYLAAVINAEIHHYTFVIERTVVTRLCKNYTIVTVNGQLPGPTIHVHNGDTVIVKAYNRAQHNATLHWHGVKQLRTGWADGPAYITQCPIPPGGHYTQRFTISGQEGTLWWHSHISWLRATVHGAIVILPQRGSLYPFPKPRAEIPIIIGEWWNKDPITVINQAILTGGAPNLSDAFTINGQPGDLYPCSTSETFRLPVKRGETYLLRIVNAALNTGHFFKIARHKFTVVAVDASYTKPYKTDVIVISAGQTADVLVTADQPVGKYYMAARPYNNQAAGAFDNTTTTAIIEYIGYQNSTRPIFPKLPFYNDTPVVTKFSKALRSLASPEHPVEVPQTVHKSFISTVGLGLLPCETGNTCEGPNGTRLSASMNNISFVDPTIAILQANYFGINGVFSTDFPSKPPHKFNYTGDDIPRNLWFPLPATKVKVLKYNATVQLVFQSTNIFVAENHPMHLHGYNFYVIGEGFGNYNPKTDPLKFNLVDPPERNTVIAPVSGWVAIRFKADNPGVWFLHCHLDDHLVWGLNMVFIVKNGHGPLATLEPPPKDLPPC